MIKIIENTAQMFRKIPVWVYLLMFGFVFLVILAIGAGEHIIGGGLQHAQDKLREMFTLPAMIVFAVIMPLFLFMAANIMAKRIRDIGLPGWWSVLAIIVITGIVSYMVSNEVSNGLSTLIWGVLLLVPSNSQAKGV